MLTAERARELLEYDPETGVLRWRVANSNRIKIGDVAGHVSWSPRRDVKYLSVGIDKKHHLAHVVIWLIVTGAPPERSVDHRDCDGLNNRWHNLRLATHFEQMKNVRVSKRNRTGVKGVDWRPDTKKWRAQIMSDRKLHYLGQFSTLEEAKKAIEAARRNLHGEFARHD